MMYVEGMTEIENEETLRLYSVSSFPYMSKEDRKKLHKNTYKIAFPKEFDNPKNIVKLSDLNKVLR